MVGRAGISSDDIYLDLTRVLRSGTTACKRLCTTFSKRYSGRRSRVILYKLSLNTILTLGCTVSRPGGMGTLILVTTRCGVPRGLLGFRGVLFHFVPGAVFGRFNLGGTSIVDLYNAVARLSFESSLYGISYPTLVIYKRGSGTGGGTSGRLTDCLDSSRFRRLLGTNRRTGVRSPRRLTAILRRFCSGIRWAAVRREGEAMG